MRGRAQPDRRKSGGGHIGVASPARTGVPLLGVYPVVAWLRSFQHTDGDRVLAVTSANPNQLTARSAFDERPASETLYPFGIEFERLETLPARDEPGFFAVRMAATRDERVNLLG